jgi:hypothetical protein
VSLLFEVLENFILGKGLKKLSGSGALKAGNLTVEFEEA